MLSPSPLSPAGSWSAGNIHPQTISRTWLATASTAAILVQAPIVSLWLITQPPACIPCLCPCFLLSLASLWFCYHVRSYHIILLLKPSETSGLRTVPHLSISTPHSNSSWALTCLSSHPTSFKCHLLHEAFLDHPIWSCTPYSQPSLVPLCTFPPQHLSLSNALCIFLLCC